MRQNKSGYILILTLMAISLITAIITKMYYQSSAFLPFSDLAVKRQKAASLALGGLQMALSKLNGSGDQNNLTDEGQKTKSKQAALLERILPIINRWQIFNLKDNVDGVNGVIKICICCENGKINLNQLYDFNKHEFKDQQKDPQKTSPYQQLLQELFIVLGRLSKNEIDPKLASQALIKFLSERQYQLLDVTELLQIPQFSYFKQHVFYEPLSGTDQNSQNGSNQIYLTDIFTTWTNSPKVEPWLFSDSILALLSFPRAQPNDIMKRDGKITEWTKNLKESSNWQTDWDKTLGLVYQVNFASLPKFGVSLFETKLNPQVFSVISCATVEGITQKIYAIIKLQSENTGSSFFVIEKLYWI